MTKDAAPEMTEDAIVTDHHASEIVTDEPRDGQDGIPADSSIELAHEGSKVVHRTESGLSLRCLVGDKEVSLESLNRKQSRQLQKQIREYDQRYKNIVGPDGERPGLVVKYTPGILNRSAVVFVEFPDSLKELIPNGDQAKRSME